MWIERWRPGELRIKWRSTGRSVIGRPEGKDRSFKGGEGNLKGKLYKKKETRKVGTENLVPRLPPLQGTRLFLASSASVRSGKWEPASPGLRTEGEVRNGGTCVFSVLAHVT